MKDTLRADSQTGSHNGIGYEVFVEGFDGGGYVIDDVKIYGLPSRRNDDDSFPTKELAFAAGHALARKLIEE